MEVDGYKSPTQSGGLALVIVQYNNIQGRFGLTSDCHRLSQTVILHLTKFESYESLDLWHLLWLLGLEVNPKDTRNGQHPGTVDTTVTMNHA